MPNTFALIVLFTSPLVVFVLMARLDRPRAVIWTVLGAMLFLPSSTGLDLPGVPPLTRETLPNFAMALALMLGIGAQRGPVAAGAGLSFWPESTVIKLCFFMLGAGSMTTVLLNHFPLVLPDGVVVQEGLKLYDAIPPTFRLLIGTIPLLIARVYLRTPEAHRLLLMAIVTGGLIYAPLMLFEVRFSPQLHTWIYGFFPHSFIQQVRFGGFRPVVFMNHGLTVAMFGAAMVLSAAAMSRIVEPRRRATFVVITLGFLVVLVLCKTVSALAFTLVLLPVVALATPRTQIFVASTIVLLILAYPVLRAAELVPTETLVETARVTVGEDRAASLDFRFRNEDILLDHARERPVFGWGTFNRNRVFEADWTGTPVDVSVADGVWIIVLGVNGWVGFLAFFGLLGLPIVLLRRWTKTASGPEVPLETSALALLMAMNLSDLIPNSSLSPMSWLMAGALLGYAEDARKQMLATQAERRARRRADQQGSGVLERDPAR